MADHMITTYREKAEKWTQQAERAQRRVYMGPMARFKFQDASRYLELAAQCFRVAKRFQDAGVAYKQCGRLEEKLKNPEVAASFYHEAALCFRKDDPQEAAACYLSAVNLFCQKQRFSTAARLECEVAELMQNDRNRRLAIVHHIKAADFFRANTCFDEAADRCLLKAAHALGVGESYVEAATLFQEVGRRMLVDDLLKFNTPDAFLNAVLCLQCASGTPEPVHNARKSDAEAPPPRPTINSVKATIVALGKACSVFQGSRAYVFATDMVSAEKEGDCDFFAARLYAYNNVCRLDAWHLRILQKIGDHVQVKAVKLRKLREMQEKIRRKQRAQERSRDRIKRRQDLSTQDDSEDDTLPDSNASVPLEDTLLANTDAKPKPSTSPSPSPSSSESGSGSGSDSISDSSSQSSASSASSGSSDASSSSPQSAGESGNDSSGSAEETESSTETTTATVSGGGKSGESTGGQESRAPSESSSLSARSDSYSSRNSNNNSSGSGKKKKKTAKGPVKFAKGDMSSSSTPG